MKKVIILLILLTTTISIAQETDVDKKLEIEAKVTATGVFSNQDALPFWFYTNSNRTLGEESSFAAVAEVNATYKFGNASIEGGIAGYYRNNVNDEFQRRDLFARFKNTWLQVTLGAKSPEIVLDGLTTSNKNFLMSGNARPLPGLLIEASDPFKISKTFSLDWGIGHYVLNDDRYVDNTWVHYKRLRLITKLDNKNTITAGIQHYAQWAGTSPTEGALDRGFNTFGDVFLARKSDESSVAGERRNAIGNHLGSYFLQYEHSFDSGVFAFYHDHPFEDGSGTRLANFPDGIWGVSFEMAEKGFLNTIVYEYVDTSDQSGGTADVSGADGYFGNNLYRSGWTYEDQVIGVPFILLDPNVVQNGINSKFTSNRAQVHHLGASGSIKKFDWKVKGTYARFLGRFRVPFDPVLKNVFMYGSVEYSFNKFGNLKVFGGADLSNINSTTIGGGLTYLYKF